MTAEMDAEALAVLTAETLANLRVSVQATMDLTRCERVIVPGALMFALLDAAAERDALAARLEGAEAVIEVQDVHARLVTAERDEAMRALGKLTAERDAEPDRIAELTAEWDALAATVARVRALHQPCRCGSGNAHCDVCETLRYPCPTIYALDGEADR